MEVNDDGSGSGESPNRFIGRRKMVIQRGEIWWASLPLPTYLLEQIENGLRLVMSL
jgi:hypothetical protein